MAFPARPVSVPALIGRFESFMLDNQGNCIERRISQCSSAQQLISMRYMALLAISAYLLSDDALHVHGNRELREAFVRLLQMIGENDNLLHQPRFAFDETGIVAWALWAETKGSLV